LIFAEERANFADNGATFSANDGHHPDARIGGGGVGRHGVVEKRFVKIFVESSRRV
jgi:hypothetical protein